MNKRKEEERVRNKQDISVNRKGKSSLASPLFEGGSQLRNPQLKVFPGCYRGGSNW